MVFVRSWLSVNGTLNHRVERMTRLFTACVAAIALAQTMTVAPAWACGSIHETSVVATVMDPSGDHSTRDSDCGESSSQTPAQHGTDCLLTCVSMAGCGPPGLLSERAFDDVAATESIAPLWLVEAYPSRSLAPDRPPPRP